MKIRSMLVGFACLLGAASAQANVQFNVTTSATGGRPLNGLQLNDIITFDIRMSNDATLAPPTLDFVGGVGAAVQGYDTAIVEFVDGSIADTNFFCSNNACTNGLLNSLDPATPLAEASAAGVGNYVQFINAVTTALRNGNGSKDPGFDGIVSGGDAEFRVRFRVKANSGTTTFNIGTNTDLGLGNVIVIATSSAGANSAIVQGVNATIPITVPEPAALAAGVCALGGALGLAGVRRRILG